MTDQVQEFAHAPAQVGADGVKRWLIRQLVAEAPPILDEVTAQIRPLPGLASLLLVVGASVGLWAAIIVGVAHFMR